MRKIFTKVLSTALAVAVAASAAVYTPAKVSAADMESKLTNWSLYQAGNVADNWEKSKGDFSQLDSLTFSDGKAYAKDELKTATCTFDEKGSPVVLGGTTYLDSNANGFIADILSNGWQANYAALDKYSANNPYSIRMEMEGIKANFGEVYKLDFTSFIESEGFDCKYAKVVVDDSDTNVLYAGTLKITKDSQDFSIEFGVVHSDVINVRIFLGAFPVANGSDPVVTTAEANWKGIVHVSDFRIYDTGKADERLKKIEFKNGTKVVKSTVAMEGDMITAPTVKKAGYKFAGWYAGSTKFVSTNPVLESATYVAKWTKVVKPAKVKIKSVASNKRKKLTVTVKNVKKADGYVYKLINNKGKALKTKFSKKTKYTFSKLKSNQKYYVQVKAYTLDSKNKKYQSKKWSKKKGCYIS